MPKSIEAQGVTVDEAIQNALNSLGLGRDSVEIEILHHPRAGFLGIGARRAKVRATQREQVMRDGEEFDMSPDDENARGRRRRRSGRRRSGRGAESRGRTAAEPQPRHGTAEARKPAAVPDGKPSSGVGGQKAERSRGETRRQRSDGRGGRGDRSRAGGEGRRPQEVPGTPGDRPVLAAQSALAGEPERTDSQRGRGPDRVDERSRRRREPALPSAPKVEPEVLRERARTITKELLRLMGYDAEVEARIDDASCIDVAVSTQDDENVLVGRRGTTLDALEHVVNRMTVGADPSSRIRVNLDVCEYRSQRRAALGELAKRLKEHALATGRRAQVTPLSPTDRVVFQQALAGDELVTTKVSGAGYYRRVVVAARDQSRDAGGAAAEFSDDGYLLSSGEEEAPGEQSDPVSLERHADVEPIGSEGNASEESKETKVAGERSSEDGA